MEGTFVIVGASLAGGTAAATLREEGFDGKLILIGAESHPPYERPPLSKEYLRGEAPFEESLVRPATFYGENEIQTLFGSRVLHVHPNEHAVEVEGGRRIKYEKLLIATGGRNRHFPIPGLDLGGVYDLRMREDADRIRAEATPGRKAVVVGMGFIGSEVAASLRMLGLKVTGVEGSKVPLHRVLGEGVGRVLEGIHRDHGVEMIFEDPVAAFEGSGHVDRVVTKTGRMIECDFAVVGLGAEPVTELVQGTDVKVDNGIVVDEYCRTSVEEIYAAGDIANHYHPLFGRHVRVEHWQNAQRQGASAAQSMLGRSAPYEDVHWFWSDQYDANIQYAGFHTTWDELVVRGRPEDRNFIAFYVKDGLIDAAVALNRANDLRRAMSLIKARLPVESSALRDDDTDLRRLAGSGIGVGELR
ncbi:MAG: NAD(P)/FAD-dependent oxidoreductase [Actinomycetota bacterium]